MKRAFSLLGGGGGGESTVPESITGEENDWLCLLSTEPLWL